ncbi:flavodoxin domain-containing protein [Ningiella sp. W23]|uniref:flavodoxin domain-containing protein n=1 Tax=Ningiella sp. W23 TaxID=3023715 RepID=UPI00375763E1
MQVLIGYCSSQGQTRKVARFIMSHIARQGHGVEMLELKNNTDIDVSQYDRVVLAASVHVGQYQRVLTDFIAAHTKLLNTLPSLFVSVSLVAAGHDADDWRELDKIVDDLSEATAWQPNSTIQVAGAYSPSQYDIFTRFIMRRIIAKREPERNLDEDHEYTDWDKLRETVDAWLK